MLACSIIAAASCKKSLTEKPEDQVDVTNHYQNVFDANAAVIGIYGQFMGLADRYIVLNELRADLVSPTVNADIYLKQINEHSETADNPWADPRPWYRVIMSCNDAMYHFDDMYKTGKLKQNDYQQRYSDIGTLRCWLYLQLGIHFGTIPYVTDPISSIDDLKDTNKFPRITLDQLIPKLAAFMNDPNRYLEQYSTNDPITASAASSLNTTVDGYPTALFFINKYCFLGDINLWAGNYNLASKAYRYWADYGTRYGYSDASFQRYEYFKVCYDAFNISYTNNSEDQLVDGQASGYRELFANPTNSTNLGAELQWRLPFNNSFQPKNPFVDLFSNQGGRYQLTVSKALMDNFNSQIQVNGFPYDARMKVAVRTINGQPVIAKQLYYYLNSTNFLPINALQQPGYWLLYRTSALQQHFAESALNDGQNKVAYALHNVGIKNMFNPYAPSAPPSSYDVTNTEQTFLPPPYDFDARGGGPQNYHTTWYREVGTRTRANLMPLDTSYISKKVLLEDAIIDDNARELCFEGYRWGDLVRIARRRNDPSFLANKVYQKLVKEGNPAAGAVQAKLMNQSGWFMPFKL